jgi:UDP-2-acetamido-3-amino-2,3-dideoxy-glucuronate N-acetyltransferase
VKIGNNVKIQNNVSVYEGVTLEDYVFCGPSMVFTNVKTPRCAYPRNTSADYQKTLVKKMPPLEQMPLSFVVSQ